MLPTTSQTSVFTNWVLDNLHSALVAETESLRKFLGDFSTQSVVATSSALLTGWFNTHSEVSPLISPLKQMFFVIGLLLSTPEAEIPRAFGDEEFQLAVPKLNAIYEAYVTMYRQHPIAESRMPEEHKNRVAVSMSAFLFHFNTRRAASIEDISEWVKRYLFPFDKEFLKRTNLTPTRALEIALRMRDLFQEQLDTLHRLLLEEYEVRMSLFKRADDENWTLDELREHAREGRSGELATELYQALNEHLQISVEELISIFGEADGRGFWERFVCKRGDSEGLMYLTEPNPVELRPLILLQSGKAFCISINALVDSVFDSFEREALDSGFREQYLRRRDESLEVETAEVFRRLFPKEHVYLKLFESPNTQYEHDVVVLFEGNLLIIEAKASSLREPLRDPEKAFVRIRDDFRSESGIQGAFDQGNRLAHRLATGEEVILFNEKGEEVLRLTENSARSVNCLCITRNSYGPLAVDLSMLLDRPKGSEYPWSIGILDLSYLADAWTYFGLGPSRLIDFLEQRRNLHGKLVSFDELEIAGFYLEHGSLLPLVEFDADRIQMDESYSDIFDQVYAVGLGRPSPEVTPRPPKIERVAQRLAKAVKN